jgi:hypothetical protein
MKAQEGCRRANKINESLGKGKFTKTHNQTYELPSRVVYNSSKLLGQEIEGLRFFSYSNI